MPVFAIIPNQIGRQRADYSACSRSLWQLFL